jgi:hypothetical protein
MPMIAGVIPLQLDATAIWFSHAAAQPALEFRSSTQSLVMPFAASSTTAVQFTAARSVGLRAMLARKRAFVERTRRM